MVRVRLDERRAALAGAFEAYFDVESRYDATLADYETAIGGMICEWEATEEFYVDQLIHFREIFPPDDWKECIARQDEEMDELDQEVQKELAEIKEEHQEDIGDYREEYENSK